MEIGLEVVIVSKSDAVEVAELAVDCSKPVEEKDDVCAKVKVMDTCSVVLVDVEDPVVPMKIEYDVVVDDDASVNEVVVDCAFEFIDEPVDPVDEIEVSVGVETIVVAVDE